MRAVLAACLVALVNGASDIRLRSLGLGRPHVRAATQSRVRSWPSASDEGIDSAEAELSETRKVLESWQPMTELERRQRAIVSHLVAKLQLQADIEDKEEEYAAPRAPSLRIALAQRTRELTHARWTKSKPEAVPPARFARSQ
jgi:hypothetical protein